MRLDIELHQKLKIEAASKNVSMSSLLGKKLTDIERCDCEHVFGVDQWAIDEMAQEYLGRELTEAEVYDVAEAIFHGAYAEAQHKISEMAEALEGHKEPLQDISGTVSEF